MGMTEVILNDILRQTAPSDATLDTVWSRREEVLCSTAGGSVANFAQEVVKGQWPLSAGGLGGQGVEQFSRSKALVSFLNHQLSFPDHVHEFYTY